MLKLMTFLAIAASAVFLNGCSKPHGGTSALTDSSFSDRVAEMEIREPNGRWRLMPPRGFVVNPYEPVRVTPLHHIRPTVQNAVTFGIVPAYSSEPPTGPSTVSVTIFRIESPDITSIYQPLLVGPGVSAPSSTTLEGRLFWSFVDPAGEQATSYYVARKGEFVVEFQVRSDTPATPPAILNELWRNLELAE